MCCHHPNLNCTCRKPNIGLFQQAIKDFNIDITNSWMIGDKQKDMIAGKKV
jgi:D-glycero-D-manno-heptose 1,7-bisphosphate phosphatase